MLSKGPSPGPVANFGLTRQVAIQDKLYPKEHFKPFQEWRSFSKVNCSVATPPVGIVIVRKYPLPLPVPFFPSVLVHFTMSKPGEELFSQHTGQCSTNLSSWRSWFTGSQFLVCVWAYSIDTFWCWNAFQARVLCTMSTFFSDLIVLAFWCIVSTFGTNVFKEQK